MQRLVAATFIYIQRLVAATYGRMQRMVAATYGHMQRMVAATKRVTHLVARVGQTVYIHCIRPYIW